MREYMDYVKVQDLLEGDMVDLEDDPYADAPGCEDCESTHDLFKYEFAVVFTVEKETPECVAVGFDHDVVGFPTNHELFVVSREEPEDRL